MLVKLSPKGQIRIPKVLRKKLELQAGMQFYISVEGNKLVLIPQKTTDALEYLRGKYRGLDLLGDLELEHQRDVGGDIDP